MNRAVVAILSCASALAVGVYTACLSARNRARGGELDRRQHLCETFSRQSELLRATNAEEEWRLEHGDPDHELARDETDLEGVRLPEH